MARALQLARRGIYSAHPNPRVGCVLAVGGEIVAEGWHALTGKAHAEVLALEAASGRARGATAYLTLEPCAHTGRTGPCADALIAAGIRRVVAAMRDPFIQVAGNGFEKLRAAGLSVDVGLMQDEARALNRGFLSRVERSRPWVRLKMATSLDGATAMLNGESRWITGEASRRDVQRLRAQSGAILTGVGTVNADDPALTLRDDYAASPQPLRAVVDSRLSINRDARLLQDGGITVLFCTDDGDREGIPGASAEIVRTPANDGRPSLAAVLRNLAERKINDVLVEAGPTLTGSLLTAGLVDELVIYQAPHIMGSETRGLAATPGWSRLADRLQLQVTDRRAIGADTRITAVPTIPPSDTTEI
ncbi:MAG: bifunctional diaminohydroxyphosphoribosylaminopyrimidine deaminase/5-amino-6-(5-phosphoribosylamino)uracil reductase RibD [Halioglobus sp.]|nr:bifunctional diaminohydroxyphosphoribosylaminopyrimidine deaminase/5-amino-6-(5-phosphoribosylamino)uracil reductase RibD [Halioglobus sp.]